MTAILGTLAVLTGTLAAFRVGGRSLPAANLGTALGAAVVVASGSAWAWLVLEALLASERPAKDATAVARILDALAALALVAQIVVTAQTARLALHQLLQS